MSLKELVADDTVAFIVADAGGCDSTIVEYTRNGNKVRHECPYDSRFGSPKCDELFELCKKAIRFDHQGTISLYVLEPEIVEPFFVPNDDWWGTTKLRIYSQDKSHKEVCLYSGDSQKAFNRSMKTYPGRGGGYNSYTTTNLMGLALGGTVLVTGLGYLARR